MRPFAAIDAPAIPLGIASVDTDQLIPARFMQTPRAQGYGGFLLHDLRRTEAGDLKSDFPLNDTRYKGAATIIARRNFGCGSSRESAVYTLVDSAISCVIAPSFGDIFASNAAKNGLLAAVVDADSVELLLSAPEVQAGENLQVDLVGQLICAGHHQIHFDIREDRKLRLLNGWGDLELTLSRGNAIAQFSAQYSIAHPWAGAPDLSPLRNIGRKSS